MDLIPNSSEFIRNIRKEYGLNQKDVAKHANCSRSYVSMIENNKRFPSKQIFDKILEFDSDNKYLKNLLNFNYRKIVSICEIPFSNGYSYGLIIENSGNYMSGHGNLFVAT